MFFTIKIILKKLKTPDETIVKMSDINQFRYNLGYVY